MIEFSSHAHINGDSRIVYVEIVNSRQLRCGKDHKLSFVIIESEVAAFGPFIEVL